MFTGIIEACGVLTEVFTEGTNKTFRIMSPISNELKADQSLSHNGVCLTVEEVGTGYHQVTAIAETLSKTDLGTWEIGKLINLERCVPMHGRLDGHLVQGHVDTTATCVSLEDQDGSWLFTFEYPIQFAHLLIEKGSICLNGISLTALGLESNRFSVAIIPFTFEHTNMKELQPGGTVNLEFDMIGKYLARWKQLGMA